MPDALGHGFLHEDVGDLQPAAGPQHPRHLAQPGRLVGHQVEHPVGDHGVGPPVSDRQLLAMARAELQVLQARRHAAHARLLEHRRGHVDADHPPVRPDYARGDQAVDARAAAHVDDLLARPQLPEAERVAGAREGLDRALRKALQPFFAVLQQRGQRPPRVEVKALLRVCRDLGVLGLDGLAASA